MRTIETKVYQFDELTDEAKEKARNWFRSLPDLCDFDATLNDAVECANLLGIDIDQRKWTNSYGFSCSEPKIYFSGFSNQGDGASFDGLYKYQKGAAKAIRQHAPQDAELHRIADELQKVQKAHFYRLMASCTHRGHYYHSGCMSVDVEDSEDCYKAIGEAADEIKQLMRDFADWIYKQLEAEYDYQMSDEAVDETIRCNEYEFTEDGERA